MMLVDVIRDHEGWYAVLNGGAVPVREAVNDAVGRLNYGDMITLDIYGDTAGHKTLTLKMGESGFDRLTFTLTSV